jgi:mannose-1-phosphate guanylyltransferase
MDEPLATNASQDAAAYAVPDLCQRALAAFQHLYRLVESDEPDLAVNVSFVTGRLALRRVAAEAARRLDAARAAPALALIDQASATSDARVAESWLPTFVERVLATVAPNDPPFDGAGAERSGRPPWAVVLAGGDGTRLQRLVDAVHGDGRPKQFATILGDRSLLRMTLDRVGRITSPERTVIVSVERHRTFLETEVGSEGYWILEQPDKRGTAAAVLWAALWLAHRDPAATMIVLPSDHHLTDPAAVARHLFALAAHADAEPGRLVLLAAVPSGPDPAYGWVEMGNVVAVAGAHVIRAVRRFVEKPSPSVALAMLRHGWLWNTFMVVGRAAAFIDAGNRHLPWLMAPLTAAAQALGTDRADVALQSAFARMQAADFSRDVLELMPGQLGVSALRDGEWADLGTAERVAAVIGRPRAPTSTGERPLLVGASSKFHE